MPNRAALAIMTRNSRMPESLAADLDAECSACLMGARRLGELFDRYGRDTVESCFDAIIDRTTTTYRREILSKIPVGEWVWEDYAEHDGVDEPMLHTQRITLTRTAADDPDGERLILDFGGTSPQAKGPINHCGDYADGVFLKKWLAPILRNLADTPERMAELDVNEGVVPLIEMRFPPPGTLLTPVFPAPTNARTFVILRLLGVLAGVVAKAVDGRMPADQETIRYTGVYGDDLDGRPYLMREVLGGGSGGRYYADGEDTIHVVPDSRNLPSEFTEARFPFRVETLGLATDSGGAGQFRGGLGYEKHIRMLKDAHFMSIADRSILACWGVKGGLAGQPFSVVIDPGGPNERQVEALADADVVRAGEVIRIRTTGGGGWGNPLARDPELVVRDVVWRKVSPEAAFADYGVVLTGWFAEDNVGYDAAATAAERAARPAASEAFFDRGPGYARLCRRRRCPRTSTGCDRRTGRGPRRHRKDRPRRCSPDAHGTTPSSDPLTDGFDRTDDRDMESSAETVEDYLASLPDERREAVSSVRDVINKHLPDGYAEQMDWGMISWVVPRADYPDTYNKKPLCFAALASQKNHLAVYLMGLYEDGPEESWFRQQYADRGTEARHGQVLRAIPQAGGAAPRRAGRGDRDDPGRRVHRALRGLASSLILGG